MSSNPNHVAIIMDGNSRWAKQNNLSQKEGHKAGVKAARNAIEFAVKNDIKYLTLYAFSTENWKRSKKEVKSLMELFVDAMKEETPELIKNSVRANFIGDISRLKKSIIVKIAETKGLTGAYKPKMNLNIAISYGGRWDVVQAAKKIAMENNSIFVPFQSIFDEAVKYAEAKHWAGDGVHPSPHGASLMAHFWLQAIQSLPE